MGVGWLLLALSWFLVIAILVALAIRIFPVDGRWGSRRAGGSDSAGVDHALAARALLDHRLAAGEIDVETYRVLRSELGDGERMRQ